MKRITRKGFRAWLVEKGRTRVGGRDSPITVYAHSLGLVSFENEDVERYTWSADFASSLAQSCEHEQGWFGVTGARALKVLDGIK